MTYFLINAAPLLGKVSHFLGRVASHPLSFSLRFFLGKRRGTVCHRGGGAQRTRVASSGTVFAFDFDLGGRKWLAT